MTAASIASQRGLSRLLDSVRPSGIVDIFERAIRLRAEGRDLIDLSTGEPDFPTPRHVGDAAMRAIGEGRTRYTPVDGTQALKRAVAAKFRRDNDLHYRETEIVVTDGAKPLLATAMRAVLDPGDEVILSIPCWPSHPAMVALAGGAPVRIATGPETGFKIVPATLAAALTERTRLLVLCSPANPTGAVYSRAELEALAAVLRGWPSVRILTDDVYEYIRFTGTDFATIAQLGADMRDRTLTVNAVSKTYAMTGWRIGFGAGPADWIGGIRRILTQTSGGPCSISQAAAVAALEGPQSFLSDWVDHYRSRRDSALARLDGVAGISVRAPDGAFYLMPDVGDLFGVKTAEGRTLQGSGDVAAWFLEHGVVVVPGSVFDADRHVRLSIAASRDSVDAACDRIAAACRRCG